MDFNTEKNYLAEKPGAGKTSKVRLNMSPTPQFEYTHNKNKVDVKVFSENQDRTLPMVIKRITWPESVRDYVSFWKELVAAGIPTLPTVRVISKEEVLITDLSADGSVFYGKADVFPSYERFHAHQVTKTDNQFLKIDPLDIKKRAESIAKKATSAGIYLPFDDPFDILVHPDGTWDIIVLDIAKGKFSPNIGKNNAHCVNKITQYVSLIRNGLTGQGKPPSAVA